MSLWTYADPLRPNFPRFPNHLQSHDRGFSYTCRPPRSRLAPIASARYSLDMPVGARSQSLNEEHDRDSANTGTRIQSITEEVYRTPTDAEPDSRAEALDRIQFRLDTVIRGPSGRIASRPCSQLAIIEDDRDPPPPYSSVNTEYESSIPGETPPVNSNAPMEDVSSPNILECSDAAAAFDDTDYIVQQQDEQANEEDIWPLANLNILERSHTATVFGEPHYEHRRHF
jgi:hypothetical protein